MGKDELWVNTKKSPPYLELEAKLEAVNSYLNKCTDSACMPMVHHVKTILENK